MIIISRWSRFSDKQLKRTKTKKIYSLSTICPGTNIILNWLRSRYKVRHLICISNNVWHWLCCAMISNIILLIGVTSLCNDKIAKIDWAVSAIIYVHLLFRHCLIQNEHLKCWNVIRNVFANFLTLLVMFFELSCKFSYSIVLHLPEL